MRYDLIVAGAGPSGSVCAAHCARAGMRVLLIDRSRFPRDKVCGDCLNPSCWSVFRGLGAEARIASLPGARLREVVLADAAGREARVALPPDGPGETGIRRSVLDACLLDLAREAGAEVLEGRTVLRLDPGWKVAAGDGVFESPRLVAADGRNSTVARLAGLRARARSDRAGLQTHFPSSPVWEGRVMLRLLPDGYAGLADIGGGMMNLCLVGKPRRLDALKAWAGEAFGIEGERRWAAISPLDRAPLPAAREGLFLVGDAARVVEPFTGEGIYYALASGELAARFLVEGRDWREYPSAHAALYRGRLWVNRLARLAVREPLAGAALFGAVRSFPPIARMLTAKVVAMQARRGSPGSPGTGGSGCGIRVGPSYPPKKRR